mmetsp:Transcript_42186/g.102422  ORF Transcript_42186/g.102422 Transcript_42186/m.102422 type:complete len:101 (-) Transcript_42186:100-402(-)
MLQTDDQQSHTLLRTRAIQQVARCEAHRSLPVAQRLHFAAPSAPTVILRAARCCCACSFSFLIAAFLARFRASRSTSTSARRLCSSLSKLGSTRSCSRNF